MGTVPVNYLDIFVGILVLSFAVFCFLAGGFTAYFGTGRSKSIGMGLMLMGAVGLVIFLWFTGILGAALPLGNPWPWNLELMALGIVAVIATIVGALAALGIFLMAIMRT